MDIEKILKTLFILIDCLYDMDIREWNDLMSGNIDYFVLDLSDTEKLEVVHGLMKLHVRMSTKEWHRRFNLVKKINELI